jgi:hypothetical protein
MDSPDEFGAPPKRNESLDEAPQIYAQLEHKAATFFDQENFRGGTTNRRNRPELRSTKLMASALILSERANKCSQNTRRENRLRNSGTYHASENFLSLAISPWGN